MLSEEESIEEANMEEVGGGGARGGKALWCFGDVSYVLDHDRDDGLGKKEESKEIELDYENFELQ